jgi:hypothetical protein
MSSSIGGEAESYQPPEYPECTWCAGVGIVEVAAIRGDGGQERLIPFGDGPDLACPHCKGGGSEPPPDPLVDDPRIP